MSVCVSLGKLHIHVCVYLIDGYLDTQMNRWTDEYRRYIDRLIHSKCIHVNYISIHINIHIYSLRSIYICIHMIRSPTEIALVC